MTVTVVALMSFGSAVGALQALEAPDSLELMVLAWANIEGYEPIEHPAGPATSVCLVLDPWQGRRGAVGFSDLSAELRTRFVESLENGGDLDVRDDCVFDETAEEVGGWWVDGDGAPASRVMLTRLEARRAGRWSVAFWIGQAGVWGREEVCAFDVRAPSGRVVLDECRLSAIS